MYSVVLVLHSYLRWVVLALAVAAIVTRRAGLLRALVIAADVQFGLGALLYAFLSPISRAFLAAGGAGMKDSTLRFFGIEHAFGMVVALALLHVGNVRAKRASDEDMRSRRVRTWAMLATLALVVSIPWPFVRAARPLFRGVESSSHVPAAGASTCPPVFQARCAACHGAEGRGDGVAAQSLRPPPRDFGDATWQGSKTDAHLHDVIEKGGGANGLSVAMPGNPDLSPSDVDALVQCVRSFKR